MGRGRAVVIARAPSAASVAQLEALAASPFAKNSDLANAVRECLTSQPATASDAETLIGRAGYAILGRLLEVFAGAVRTLPGAA